MTDYRGEKISNGARQCANFGKEFKSNAFKKPRVCMSTGFDEICTMKGRCVYASHECAERWKSRLKARSKANQNLSSEYSHAEAVNAVRPIFSN